MLFRRAILPILSTSLVGLIRLAYAELSIHDDLFIPDAILHVTEGERKQSCVPSKDILLVNGTSPGPKLRFTEGKTVWIRVFNDIPNQNLTMVSPFISSSCYLLMYLLIPLNSIGTALQWQQLLFLMAPLKPPNGQFLQTISLIISSTYRWEWQERTSTIRMSAFKLSLVQGP